jgi:hypothetical protein
MPAVFSGLDFYSGKPWPAGPFWFTSVIYDIPETVAHAIKSLPPNCVKVTLGGHAKRNEGPILAALSARGMAVDWVDCEGIMLRQCPTAAPQDG